MPDADGREQQERHAGKKHGSERDMPVDAHPLHHRIGEVGIQPHARRERDRIARKSSHQQAAHGRREAGRGSDSGGGHTGFVQDRRVDEDDVRHRHERRDAREKLRLPVGSQRRELEVPFRALDERH